MVSSGGSPEEEAPQKDGGRSDGVGQPGLTHGAYFSTPNTEWKVNEHIKSIYNRTESNRCIHKSPQLWQENNSSGFILFEEKTN